MRKRNISNKISIIGLGKLGTPFALTFAEAGFEVFCIDANTEIINNLGKGICALYERNVQELLTKNIKRFYFPSSYDELISNTDITFIIVPTPSQKNGSFSLAHIFQVIQSLGKAIKRKKNKHTIVITSTVSPLSMKKIACMLEKTSGKHVGKDLGLCYSPEFIALGSVIYNLEYPDFLLIGESDKQTGDLIEYIRMKVCKNKPRIVRTNWVNAELAKISLNTYITTKISFANMIARICERIPGADADVVANAVGSDSRVGMKYLKGGLGYGGPCFPRDNIALASLIQSLSLNNIIPSTIHSYNQSQTDSIFNLIKKYLNKKSVVGILGLSYKPETDVVDESQGLALAKRLYDEKFNIIAFDPAATENAKRLLPQVVYTQSAEACIQKADVIFITTPWKQFRTILWKKNIGKSKKTIIDCWKILKKEDLESMNIKYISLGSFIN